MLSFYFHKCELTTFCVFGNSMLKKEQNDSLQRKFEKMLPRGFIIFCMHAFFD